MSSPRLLVSVPDELVRSNLEHLSDNADFVVWEMAGPAPAAQIDIVVPPYLRPVSVLRQLTGVRVRLVQDACGETAGRDAGEVAERRSGRITSRVAKTA